LLVAWIALAGSVPLRAQTVPADRGGRVRPVDPAELAGKRYADRRRATLEMWRQRDRSRQAVQNAARDADPEIAARANWILRQWRSGALPGVAEDVEALTRQGSGSALAAVLEQGAFDAVLIAVEESAGTIEFDQIKSRVARLITQRFPMYVDQAYADGSEATLLKLVRATAVDRNMAIAADDLARSIGRPHPTPHGDDAGALPPAAEAWPELEKYLLRSQRALMAGRVDRAIEYARKSDDPVLTRLVQMIGGRWETLAADSFAVAESANEADARVEAYAWSLVGAYHSDDPAGVEKAVAFLADDSINESVTARDFRFRALALHDHVDQGIDVLAKEHPAMAARIACEASRFQRGFAVLGYPSDEVSLRLDDWITDAYAQQAGLPAGQLAESMERLYALARLLNHVGRRDEALQIYRRLTPRQVIVDPYGSSLRDKTIDEMQRIGKLDWVRELAVEPQENALSALMRAGIARALSTESDSFQAVLDRIKDVTPDANFQTRFRIAFDLFRGKTPAGFDPGEDFRRLFDALVRNPHVRRVGRRLVKSGAIGLDAEIIDLFLRHGQVELAREGLQVLASGGDVDAMLALAANEMARGDSEAAWKRFEEAGRLASRFTATDQVVTLDHGLTYAKSIAGRWVLAGRAGHQQLADQLERRLRLMLASPSLTFRKELADYLRELKQYRLAVEVLHDLIIHVSFGGSDAPDFFRVAVSYVGALEDLKESEPEAVSELEIDPYDVVRWGDLAVLGIMSDSRYYASAFVSVPLSVRKSMLQHAIDTENAELAQTAISRIERLDPLNIDFGERLLPKVREAGMGAVADAAFDRLFDRGRAYLGDFGTDATSLNNLAWAAAMNGRALEQALQLSETAVMLQPDSVVFRDTLAELLHLTGRTEEALAIETACLLDEPDEWHLHQQIEKYREALSR
jgi:tetratricopeptide (TPR) repeat protein